MQLNQLIGASKVFVMKNSPLILTTLGAIGVVTTTAMAIRATGPALTILAKDDLEHGRPVKRVDQATRAVKLCWHLYVPTAIVGGATIGAIIGAHSIHSSRNLAIAGAYSILEQTAKTYEEAVLDTVGEKKVLEVGNRVATHHLEENPVEEHKVFNTGKGDTLTFDTITGRYFRTDLESLRQAQNTFNARLLQGTWMSLNEFYSEIGLEPIDIGDDIGWTPERMLDCAFTSRLANDGTPCMVLAHNVLPTFDKYAR